MSAVIHVPLRLSPSRIDKFDLCPARWGFAELPGGVAEPDSEETAFGTDTHLSHELYYNQGKPHDLNTRAGWCANGMLEDGGLPRALPPGGVVEHELTYVVDGVILAGRLDLAYIERVPVVRDYKTCGNFRFAKLERDALFGHPQAPFYALVWMHANGAMRAKCGWVYGTRPALGPAPWAPTNVQRSDHEITRDEATERVHVRMVPAAKQMQAYADAGLTAADAGTLPKNLRACRKFNRLCPYYFTCKPIKEQDMSEANAFLAGLNLGTPTPPAASAAVAVAPTAPATQPTTPPATDATPPTPPTSPAAGLPINPPEGGDPANKGKGKGKGTTAPVFTPEVIDALTDAIVDKIALRLMRNVK